MAPVANFSICSELCPQKHLTSIVLY